MNSRRNQGTTPSPAEMIFMHRQSSGSGRWVPPPEGDLEVRSLSVFGAGGSRFSVMVMERMTVTPELAGRQGNWTLADRWQEGRMVSFQLLWVADAEEEGCLMLCGREVPAAFSTSA